MVAFNKRSITLTYQDNRPAPRRRRRSNREEQMGTSLKSHNVVVNGHRTSMRLEPEMWDALRDISLRENLSINQLCTLVNRVRDRSSLTSAVRVFALAYFRSVAARQDESASGLGSLQGLPQTDDQTGDQDIRPSHPLDAALGLTRQQIAAERTQRPV